MTSYLFSVPSLPTNTVTPTSSRPWGFTVQVFKPTGSQTSPDIYIFNYDDISDKSFMYIASPQPVVVEADREVQMILEKTKTHNRANIWVVSGTESKWGDFKVASVEVTSGNQAKSAIIELMHPFSGSTSGFADQDLQQTVITFMKRFGVSAPPSSHVMFHTSDRVAKTIHYMVILNRILKDK
eukprot:TRINITY_DN15429_c0_g1_i1.p1 TRINITY_DN15429_c0_g1~~TRINITY_DN15429_c0_g1_i1.p1  ORF type:complete len:183 (-),score=29.75 TRINITY_DN15429_c0_g1_i1:44-592(-)